MRGLVEPVLAGCSDRLVAAVSELGTSPDLSVLQAALTGAPAPKRAA